MDATKKKILVTTAYFPPKTGGSARYSFESSIRLAQTYGWQVIIATSSDTQEDTTEEIAGMEIHRLSFKRKISNTPFALSWVWKIRKLIKESKPDIIIIHTPVIGIGDIASLLAGKIPTVVAYHTCGSMVKNDGSLLDVFIKLYEKYLLPGMFNRSKNIICSSDYLRLNFLKKYSTKSITLASAVDHEIFSPKNDDKPTEPTILFVSNLTAAEKYKGLQILLEAMTILKSNIPGIKLNVVGDGDMLEQYKSFVSKNNLDGNVNFSGRLGGTKLTEAYQKAHIFALPTSYDSLPNVILEAMSCELPIVSTKIGDIPAVIDGKRKAGFVIEKITSNNFAEKIEILLKNQDVYKEFSKNARDIIEERMSWNQRAKDLDQILKKIV